VTALRRAVFFDRDDVLNVDRGGYTHRPEDLVWTPGARAAVKAVNEAGRLAIVVSNQSGVGRGYFDEAALERFQDAMQAQLAEVGARIDAFYACFHHPDALGDYRVADHPDRKPNPGMLLRAAREHGIDLAGSVLIGDRESDMEAARRAGVRGFLYAGGDLEILVRAAMAEASDGGPATTRG
jgi:D-glycero-D-manno-heptose 1,7-bisphosphate phosphatase